MKLTDFSTPGTRVWSRKYLTYGTVDHPAKKLVHVTMDNTGQIRALPVSDLEFTRESAVQVKLRSTRKFSSPPASVPLNSKSKRLQRNGAERYSLLTKTQKGMFT